MVAALTLLVSACMSTSPQAGTPIGIITMNARTKGAGYTTSAIADFYTANNITFASAGSATDSCQAAAYTSTPIPTTATRINAGSGVAIAVSGRVDTLKKSGSSLTYASTLASGLSFTPGDTVTVTVAGDIAAFFSTAFSAKTAEPFTASALSVPAAGQALPVTWTPAAPGAAMVISLRYNDATQIGSGLNAQIFCDFVDDGVAVIPAALVAKWAASPQRDTYMQRLRTMIWLSPSAGQYVNLISTFELPTPVSP